MQEYFEYFQQVFGDASEVWDAYAQMIYPAIQVTFLFGVCNILVDIVINAFFNGKLHFGGRF